MKKTIGTVCFIVEDNKVLLVEFEPPTGPNYWSGIGGVVDEGEAPINGLMREISEETLLSISKEDVQEVTIVHIRDLELHVFVATKWTGELKAIEPSLKQIGWFDFQNVPYAQMRPGNEEWLPSILEQFKT